MHTRHRHMMTSIFFRWTWTSILLPENRVSWISPNIWRDTVSKCTHRLLKEGNNLERSLYCACGGCYPRLSGGGSNLIKKVPMMERLPRRINIVEHRYRQLLHAKSNVILHKKNPKKFREFWLRQNCARARQGTAFWSLSSPKSHKMSVFLAF